MYSFLLVRNGEMIAMYETVGESFGKTTPTDEVFVRYNRTGFTARVLRPG